LASFGKRLPAGFEFPPHAAATVAAVETTVTIPFPPDLFEALAERVAVLLAEQPSAQRYMDSDAAADHLGIPAKTLKTKDWRDEHGVPYGYIGGRLLFDRLALDERFAACSGSRSGSYTVTRVAPALTRVAP
jgi:hypothetical protein